MTECKNFSVPKGCIDGRGVLCPKVDLPIEGGVAKFRIPLVFCTLTNQELTNANVGSVEEILAENAVTFLGGGGSGGMLFKPIDKG